MAILILLSTFNISIYKHFCGNILVETTVSHLPEGCGMEMAKDIADNCFSTIKNCCSDEHILIEGQDELLSYSLSAELEIPILPYIPVLLYDYSFELDNNNVQVFKTYKPPLILRHIFKLDESYLI
jgi:hypothetical protein